MTFAPGEKATVLFVDDEPRVLAGLRDALWRGPFNVLTAESPEEGKKLLAEHDVSVVVSDERMPGTKGSDFLGWVSTCYPQIPCIMLTGEASLDANARNIQSVKMYRFLHKPVTPDDLRQVLGQAIRLKELFAHADSGRRAARV